MRSKPDEALKYFILLKIFKNALYLKMSHSILIDVEHFLDFLEKILFSPHIFFKFFFLGGGGGWLIPIITVDYIIICILSFSFHITMFNTKHYHIDKWNSLHGEALSALGVNQSHRFVAG